MENRRPAGPATETAGHHVVEVLTRADYRPFAHEVGQLETVTQVRARRAELGPYRLAERDDLSRPVLFPRPGYLEAAQRFTWSVGTIGT